MTHKLFDVLNNKFQILKHQVIWILHILFSLHTSKKNITDIDRQFLITLTGKPVFRDHMWQIYFHCKWSDLRVLFYCGPSIQVVKLEEVILLWSLETDQIRRYFTVVSLNRWSD